MDTYSDQSPETQALRVSIGSFSSDNRIAELAQPQRGDDRVIAALSTIAHENAETERQALEAITVDPVAISRARHARRLKLWARTESRAKAKAQAAAKCSKAVPAGRATPGSKVRGRPSRNKGAAKRAKRCRGSRGGSRSGSDDGDGGPPDALHSVLVRDDGSLLHRVSRGGRTLEGEFSCVSEWTRCMLQIEQWEKEDGDFIGPSFLDESHPINWLIKQGLN